LVQAQAEAARFYILLTLLCISSGLTLLVIPVLVTVPESVLKIALHVGGTLIAAVGTFPSGKYLQRKDRASAIRTIFLQYEQLKNAGLLASPARRELDKMITRLVQGMIK
jgi:hypothetical protein